MISGKQINKIWESAESKSKLPEKFTDILEVEYSHLYKVFYENREAEFREIVFRLVGGSILLVRNAFSREEVAFLKQTMFDLQKKT